MTKKQYEALKNYLDSLELNVKSFIHKNSDDCSYDFGQITISVMIKKNDER